MLIRIENSFLAKKDIFKDRLHYFKIVITCITSKDISTFKYQFFSFKITRHIRVESKVWHATSSEFRITSFQKLTIEKLRQFAHTLHSRTLYNKKQKSARWQKDPRNTFIFRRPKLTPYVIKMSLSF
jgi:hypothetical protein